VYTQTLEIQQKSKGTVRFTRQSLIDNLTRTVDVHKEYDIIINIFHKATDADTVPVFQLNPATGGHRTTEPNLSDYGSQKEIFRQQHFI
jgi:hypothetical protein